MLIPLSKTLFASLITAFWILGVVPSPGEAKATFRTAHRKNVQTSSEVAMSFLEGVRFFYNGFRDQNGQWDWGWKWPEDIDLSIRY